MRAPHRHDALGGNRPGLAAFDILHVIAHSMAGLHAGKENPLAVGKEIRQRVVFDIEPFELFWTAGASGEQNDLGRSGRKG